MRGTFCHKCGELVRRKNPKYCPACGAILDINDPNYDPTPGPVTSRTATSTVQLSTLQWILLIVVILAVTAVGIIFPLPANDVVTPVASATATPSLVPTTTPEPTPAPTTTPSSITKFALGEPNGFTDDPQIFGKSYEAGIMIDSAGKAVYTQSGKNGTTELKGIIPEGSAMILDAYAIFKDGQKYSGGCLVVYEGPFDLNALEIPLGYTNGAAQLISSDTIQSFLDENVWVKFSRGDRLPDDSGWSYKPWALNEKNVWIPDGYTMRKPGDLTKETDTYPEW